MPEARELHIDGALSNFATGLMAETNFVADQLLPVVPVAKESDEYHKFYQEELSADHKLLRADGDLANEADWDTTTDSYTLQHYALRQMVTDRMRANADQAIKVEMETTRILTQKIMRAIERDAEAAINAVSTFTSPTPSTKWDASSGADPLGDIITYKSNHTKAMGRSPNVCVIPPIVADALDKGGTFTDLQKYTHADLVETAGLPPRIKGMKVIVPGVIINEANPGLTESLDYIWDSDNVIFAYVNPMVSPRVFTLGVQFRQSVNGKYTVSVRKYRDDARKGTWIEAEVANYIKIIDTRAGYIAEDVLT